MRRRLVVATVGVTALALVLAGLLSLGLVRRAARDRAERELVEQAIAIATRAGSAETFQVLARVSNELRFDDIARVSFTADGAVVGPLPPTLDAQDLRPDLLAAGNAVSGTVGPTVYAAAPVRGITDASDRDPAAVVAVVITRRADTGVERAAPWFLVAALLSLLVAAAVALELARRLSRPVRGAQQATARIAAGDLGARVAEEGGGPELRDLGRSINAMAEALARARGREREFLLSVSHDLRTPLTSVTGYAEAIADGVAADPAAAARVIGSEARRLERLVGDLLELAKLDAHQFSLSPRPIEASRVIADVVAAAGPAADRLGLTLTSELDPELPAHTDPDRVAQMVANLVDNALSHAASAIVVTATFDGPELVVTVDDDGPGIAAEEEARVFERFYRGDRRRGRAIGSGLGLAIVRELAAALEGSVVASPSPVGGTRMTLRVAARCSTTSTSSTPPDATSSSNPSP